LLVPGAALAVTGCDFGDDGPQTTQTRSVGGFTRVENHDSAAVRLQVGETQRITVRAGEKVIDDVDTEVRGDTLHVTFDPDGNHDAVVNVSVPSLSGVVASGSGEIEAVGIDADAFEVRSDGSAGIELRGTADRLDVKLDGSGEAELSGLPAREAHVIVNGSGGVEVRAAERLDADVDGSGSVRYYGDPQLTQRESGSGEISRAD
jgi:hypothetical protein